MLLPTLLLSGCLINEAAYLKRLAELTDGDDDGYAAEDDCDDRQSAVFPGAPEVCNQVDDDCDGDVDEQPTDAEAWFLDADGDGYGSGEASVQACTPPPGYLGEGGDCDDDRGDTHPGATDAPYDGIDQDCDAGDLRDVDGDGSDSSAVGGPDCNDLDAAVGPDGAETCFDGIDQDCDGLDLQDCDLDGHSPPSVGGDDCDDDDATVHPEATESWQDAGVDNDCDGSIDDVIQQGLGTADVLIDPPETSGYTGGSVGTLPDIDGDGRAEVWMTAPYASERVGKGGALYIVPSAALNPGVVLVDDAGWSVQGANATGYFGSGVSLGSVDGRAALLIGEPGAASGAGALWAVDPGELSAIGAVGVADLGVEIVVGASGDYLGIYPLAGRDFDGDGADDLFVDALGSGTVVGFSGPAWSTHATADADWTFTPPNPTTWLSPTAAGDVDDDGIDDIGLVVQIPAADEIGVFIQPGGAELAGGSAAAGAILNIVGGTTIRPLTHLDGGERVLVAIQWQASAFLEPEVGATLDPLTDADYQLFRSTDEGAFTAATDVAWLGGFAQAWVLGAPDAPSGAEQGECVVWQRPAMSDGAFSADAPVRLTGEAAGDRACQAVSTSADLSGDGDADLIVGAPLADSTAPDAGRVYIFFAP